MTTCTKVGRLGPLIHIDRKEILSFTYARARTHTHTRIYMYLLHLHMHYYRVAIPLQSIFQVPELLFQISVLYISTLLLLRGLTVVRESFHHFFVLGAQKKRCVSTLISSSKCSVVSRHEHRPFLKHHMPESSIFLIVFFYL